MPLEPHRFVTASGSRYEVFKLGHLPALVKHNDDGTSTTMVINIVGFTAPEVGRPGYFAGQHPHLPYQRGREYRITTSPVAEILETSVAAR